MKRKLYKIIDRLVIILITPIVIFGMYSYYLYSEIRALFDKEFREKFEEWKNEW